VCKQETGERKNAQPQTNGKIPFFKAKMDWICFGHFLQKPNAWIVFLLADSCPLICVHRPFSSEISILVFRTLNFVIFAVTTFFRLYKRNHYGVLGVNKNATIKEIKEAYYTKSKQYHPDNSDGNARQFLELKQAYDILR
jgi:hypothetical protein